MEQAIEGLVVIAPQNTTTTTGAHSCPM